MLKKRIMKLALGLCLFAGGGLSYAKTIEIREPFFVAPAALGVMALSYSEDGFFVQCNGERHLVEKCWIDSFLQNISGKELEEFLVSGYIAVSKMDNGAFSLQAKHFMKGGGPAGATIGAYVGKGLVSVVGHGTLFVVAGLTGAGWCSVATGMVLESWFGAAIETASLAGGIAGGIVGGMLTGLA